MTIVEWIIISVITISLAFIIAKSVELYYKGKMKNE